MVLDILGGMKKTPAQLEAEAAEVEAQKIAEGAADEGEVSGGETESYAPAKADEEGNMQATDGGYNPDYVEEIGVDLADPGIPQVEEWPFIDTRYENNDSLTLGYAYYAGGGIAIESYVTEDGEPFCRYTVNVGAGLPRGTIAVKNWSENEGAEDVLKENGIIEGEPVTYVPSGYIIIPIYKLTEKFQKYVGLL